MLSLPILSSPSPREDLVNALEQRVAIALRKFMLSQILRNRRYGGQNDRGPDLYKIVMRRRACNERNHKLVAAGREERR